MAGNKYGYRKPKQLRSADGAGGGPPAKCKAHSIDGMYSDDELDFLRAIERFKRENSRPHPTWAEVLAVAKSIGYRRVLNFYPLLPPT
jgi:hypothetical protein